MQIFLEIFSHPCETLFVSETIKTKAIMKTLEQFKLECGEFYGPRMYAEEVEVAHLNDIGYMPSGGESLYNPHDYSGVRRVKARRIVKSLDAEIIAQICITGQLPESVKSTIVAAPHPKEFLGLSPASTPFII
jgi:hypothetical protein